RNRLAELIIRALSEPVARAELTALAGDATAAERWLGRDGISNAPAFDARIRCAVDALRTAPVWQAPLTLEGALDAAATLFDASLYFETHEVLEPTWRDTRGRLRETLQGLIQIAVGYQHLANGNAAGARSLFADGAARLRRSHQECAGETARRGSAQS